MTSKLKWLLHPAILAEGPDAMRRSRIVGVAAAITAIIAGYIAWAQISAGSRPTGIASGVLMGIAFLVLALLRLTPAWRSLGMLLYLSLFATAALANASTGGALVASSFYVCLTPLLVTLTLGRRAGIVAALVGVAFLASIEYLRRDGFAFPAQISPEVAAQSAFRGAVLFQLILLGVAIIYDSLRVASLEDVAESSSRYTALVEQSRDLVSEVDVQGRVLFASPNHAAVLGVATKDLVGIHLTARAHPDDAARLAACLAEASEVGTGNAHPIRLATRSGEWRWFEPSATAYDTPSGERHVIVVDRDLTERLELEESLRQSQKMDAIGQLAGGVAHDFNNLLMVVAGYADQLVSGPKDEREIREAGEEILRAAEQGEALTRQLLAVSRPGSPQRRPLVLNSVVNTLKSMIGRLIGEDVLLEIEPCPRLRATLADPGHIEQVLVNLVVNARDAMPGGGTLRIETGEDADEVWLRVADTGVGMDEKTRTRAFDAFYTTKPRGSGTGLGLAVVYSLVTNMGGRIAIESEPETGTRVTIHLPAVATEVIDSPSPLASEAPAASRGETLLVVEDREAVRGLVTKILLAAGYRVIEAPDGERALELSRAHAGPIELVVCDVVMPHMSGPELARILRSERPGIHFLFISGHPERSEQLAQEVREGSLLQKPFLGTDLCQRVRAQLDRG